MADKSIDQLPVSDGLTNEGLLVVYQNDEARSIKGELVAQFAQASVSEQVKAAQDAKEAVLNLGVASETLEGGSPARVTKTVDASGAVTLTFGIPQGERGERGEPGPRGVGIESLARTAGNGAPGTVDTYTVTLTDGSKTQFAVYNGADGEGAGDMTTIVYDPQGKKTDVFAYVDNIVGEINTVLDLLNGEVV